MSAVLFVCMSLAETSTLLGRENEHWEILIDKSLQVDEAISVALRDLQGTGLRHGINFTIRNRQGVLQNAIVVGSPDRNELTARLVNDQNLSLQSSENPQTYEILTQVINGRRVMIVSGGSIIGDVYGLYWIRDRIRVFKEIPDINVKRSPAMKRRISLSWGRRGSAGESKEQMQRALQYSCNWVSGPAVLDLVPWNSEPERINNAKNRERARELIDYAHALHLKYYSFANEFTYHPSLLAELDASLTPDDPRFWHAVQEKYRRLFRALPELDGIELCNDDLLTPVAYKYGLHIEPVSYGQFNSFIHMRVGTFPAQGYPSIDGGKEHLEFLHGIYLRCKPWKPETIDDLDHGLKTAEIMVDRFASAQSFIADAKLIEEIKNALNMTRLLIQTNNLYVKTAFAYFEYRENPAPHRKSVLNELHERLIQTRDEFKQAPGFGYRLFGVDQLLKNTAQVLTSLDETEQRLAMLPTRDELERTITEQQRTYKQVLERYKEEAIRFLHFEVEIDGRDILIIKGRDYRIEHLRWDGPSVRQCQFAGELPQEVVTVVPKDIESRPMHPFVLQQPNEENDFTTKIYLYDKPGGFGVVNFDLYYIPRPPEALGLKNSWEIDEGH